MIIKKVTLGEVYELRSIAKKTFIETFAGENTKENLNKYIKTNLTIEKLILELTDPDSEFYFAMDNSKILGYLKLNSGKAQTELLRNKALEIERIYVLKEFHGKKVGQLLFEKALVLAREQRIEFVWLGVWEKNPRAIRFYEKNGFFQFDKHLFQFGDEEQTDIMMKLQL